MREHKRMGRGYVRSTWYNARRVARAVARNPYKAEPYPAPTPADTLADILAQPYIYERTVAGRRCQHCGGVN